MDPTIFVICFSTIGELEQHIRGVGLRDHVVFEFSGSCTLYEAATIYRKLQALVASTNDRWNVDEDSGVFLRRGAMHYEELDMLELSLELMELDLKDAVPMKKIRFDSVRTTANAVLTTADASTALNLLDDFIIESQRLARVCRGLGFGRHDTEVAKLTQEDLAWLTVDGTGALVLAGGDGDELLADGHSGGVLADVDSGGVLAGNVDSGDVLADVDSGGVLAGNVDGAMVLAGGKVPVGLVNAAEVLTGSVDVSEALAGCGNVLADVDSGDVLADADSVGVLAGNVDGAVVLAGGKVPAGLVDAAEVLTGSVDVSEALAGSGNVLADKSLLDHQYTKEELGVDCDRSTSARRGAWIQLKEKTVTNLVLLKIRKVREAVAAAKGRRVVKAV